MPTEVMQLEDVHACEVCGDAGAELYRDLRDHTFGSPGVWAMKRCRNCELLWLSPRPIERDIGQVYKTYYTHGVVGQGSTFREHVANTTATRRWVTRALRGASRVRDAVLSSRYGYPSGASIRSDKWIAASLGRLPGVSRSARLWVLGLEAAQRGRILDVGCGNGSFLARMKALGWDCVGNETDPAAARFTRENFGLDVVEGALPACRFSDSSFDVVTVSHVIEHVHDPQALIAECRRVLRPDGTLIVLTPNTRSLGHRIFGRAWRGLEPPRHLRCFNPSNLRILAERAGVRIVSITTESRMMRGIWYASRAIKRAEGSGSPRTSLRDYLFAYLMQVIESMALWVAPTVGEEVMLVARNPSAVHAATEA